jgi:Cd2+/Zn2+-exporting ATPase
MDNCHDDGCCCSAGVIPISSEPLADADGSSPAAGQAAPSFAESGRGLLMPGVGGVIAALAEVIAWTSGKDDSWPVIALSLLAIAVCGMGTYKKGWIAVKNFDLNMNALMSIAVTGALIIGQWPEAAMVMVLFALAEVIEARSLDRARNAIRSLMALSPEKATVRQSDGTWAEVVAKGVAVGALVRVKPGERIPLDGEVVKGHTSINQAPITGESMPVEKIPGDQVFAGTINENGSFDYRTTEEAGHSTLARIIKAVEKAQASRAPTQRFVDRFAKAYTPLVFVTALLVASVPPLAFGYPWMDWAYRALVLMVIACPCALVISTPVTVVSGLASAARAGILIKGGVYLEEGHKLKSLAFDKTGTITRGKPVVTDVVPLSGDGTDGLRIAAALASRSDHPVSSAISTYWETHANGASLLEVSDFGAIPGKGTKGLIGGRWHYLGNDRLAEGLGICNESVGAALDKLEEEGKTAVVVCDESAALIVIGAADTVRETSRRAIADLHELGVHTLMLTGDNAHTARVIAGSVGMDDVRGNLLPDDKLSAVNDELARFGLVGMVGDGINDAPALAKASIGFAMGAAGTDAALETADVALMDDDLRKIPHFIRLSARTAALLKQNITIALGIKAVFFALAVLGEASLWMAVFADMGASLIVIFNGLRLLQPLTTHAGEEPQSGDGLTVLVSSGTGDIP